MSRVKREHWRAFFMARVSALVYWVKNLNFRGVVTNVKPYVLASQRWITWRLPILSRILQRVVLRVCIPLLAILIVGTAFTFIKPEYAVAAPFKGIAITLARTTAGAIELIEGTRGIAAAQERKIVSTALQCMRIDEGLKFVPSMTVPINDMSCFPSSEYGLFPDYLEGQFSQFRYTVDSKGIVSVDTSWATTDSFIDNIKKLIERLENE